MADPIKPEPDPHTEDKRWSRWAIAVVTGFLTFSVIVGFIALPMAQAPNAGIDAWTAICRALGIAPGSPAQPQPQSAGVAAPVSQVEWSARTLNILNSANPQRAAQLSIETCAACHGERGMTISPDYPRLAGQSAAAIYKQLSDYRSGARYNELMTPVAQQLTLEQLAEIAAYYGNIREGPYLGSAAIIADNARTHELIYRGDPARRIASCQSCHATGVGGPPETPAITGQNAVYLANQLRAFRSGERQNDVYARMREISRQLSDEEIDMVARAYQGAY